MAYKKLTPEEKEAKRLLKEAKIKEQQDTESKINILKMMYDTVKKSKQSDVYIVTDKDKFGVVTGDGETIIPLEFTNIHTSNDRVFKVYGDETTCYNFTGISIKVWAIADYQGNLVVKPGIYSKTVNVGKRGILIGQSSHLDRNNEHKVFTRSGFCSKPEWAGNGGILTIEDIIYYVDYDKPTVLKFKASEMKNEELGIDTTEFCIETFDEYDNILALYRKGVKGKADIRIIDIDEAVEYAQTHDDTNYPMHAIEEYFDQTVTINLDTAGLIDDIMKDFYFEDCKNEIVNELKIKMKLGVTDEFHFAKHNGKWHQVTTRTLPTSFLVQKAKQRKGYKKLDSSKRLSKDVWA